METAVAVIIEGRVTGIGFRCCALDYASRIPALKGYIRNAGYGRVEAVVQGRAEHVARMLDWLKRGPPHARIDRILVDEVPLDDTLPVFTVR